MKKTFICAALLALSSGVFSAPVVYVDSNKLMPLGDKIHSFSHGYIAGIAEYMSFHGDACPPAGISPRQLHVVVMQYIEQHPKTLRYPALRTTSTALQKAFPCNNFPRD